MTVGVVGLGLIGGSIAKAYKSRSDCTLLALDTNEDILGYALLSGAADARLDEAGVASCSLLLLCAYPEGTERWLRDNAPRISKSCIVIDCLGVKRRICAVGFGLAERFGFTFVGGHPMAGSHKSGFGASRESLFDGAPMVLVPPDRNDIALLERVKGLLAPLRFGSISVTSASEHDRIIAFTSQLAHIVSNAYIKSPAAGSHRGFSAGSYKDLTRVARMNSEMWTELFMQNGDMLVPELDCLSRRLLEYRNALASGDAEALRALLEEGNNLKKAIDGK